MTGQHVAPYLVADHLALDFLNSRVGPEGSESDWLGDGPGLLEWLVAAGAIDSAVARRYGARPMAARLDAAAAEARALRQWLGGFAARHARQPLAPGVERELGPLNHVLERDAIHYVVEASDTSGDAHESVLRQRPVRRWTEPNSLLSPIAEAISDLVCHGDFRLVGACEGVDCVLMFYDRTKAHRRRWCSMALCGNRAKAAAHRARSRAP
jgi:predicted RNA-binding Zn ribbon-like protein